MHYVQRALCDCTVRAKQLNSVDQEAAYAQLKQNR